VPTTDPSPPPRIGYWLEWTLITAALFLRLLWLEEKPPHFDEGVNGAFVDGMTRDGFYHYDPSNFHGPLHFYLLFAAQTLLGRHAWALRLPIALISTGCVAVLLGFRPYFGRRACFLAALAMALSPGMVFYGRYAIHESALLLFLLLAFWAIAGLWTTGRRRFLFTLGAAAAGMVLTKETYAVHAIVILLTLPALKILEHFSPSAPLPVAPQQWNRRDLFKTGALCVLAVVFFYSGGFLDWSSLPGLWETFHHWFATGTRGASGHEKPWHYWLELLARYEWPALLGLALCPLLILPPGTPRLRRALGIAALGALSAYTLIAYKTPWCLIVLMWPFHLFFGIALDRAIAGVDAWVAGAVAALLLGTSFWGSWLLNFREPTNESEPYVYVQTLPDIEKLMAPLRTITRLDARNFHRPGFILTPEQHPLNWMLGDFTQVSFRLPSDALPDSLETGDFILADESIAGEVEARLSAPYFKEPLIMRGNALERSVLYLRESVFAACLPERTAEFVPGQPDASFLPAPFPEPSPELPPEPR
jgi:uncharacterized protein (TIGR03663 family)